MIVLNKLFIGSALKNTMKHTMKSLLDFFNKGPEKSPKKLSEPKITRKNIDQTDFGTQVEDDGLESPKNEPKKKVIGKIENPFLKGSFSVSTNLSRSRTSLIGIEPSRVSCPRRSSSLEIRRIEASSTHVSSEGRPRPRS